MEHSISVSNNPYIKQSVKSHKINFEKSLLKHEVTVYFHKLHINQSASIKLLDPKISNNLNHTGIIQIIMLETGTRRKW